MTKTPLGHQLILTIIVMAALTGAPRPARADVPFVLHQQGRIYDVNTEQPLEGTYQVTFSLYVDDTPQAAAEWTDTRSIIFENGFFSAVLTIDLSDFDGSVRYLGIGIGNDPEMTPRLEIGSVPYALTCSDAIGTIHPTSIHITGKGEVIDNNGDWVGGTAPSGPVGPTGPAGPTGPTGPTGPSGTVGPTGPQGTQGSQGPTGNPGSVGPTGPQGAQGLPGPTGPQGPNGPGNGYWTQNGSKIYYDTGNVGVGTDDPIADLQIGGTYVGLQWGSSGDPLDNFVLATDKTYSATPGFRLWSGNSGTASHLLTVLSTGKVGIGTATPGAKLAVWGGATFGGPYAAMTMGDGDAAFAGDVGIGTTGPQGPLHVYQSSGDVNVYLEAETGSPYLYLDGSSTTWYGLSFRNNGSELWKIGNAGLGAGDLVFYEDTSTPRMVLQNNGNVGIGTTSPGAKLHVDDVMKLQPRSSAPSCTAGDTGLLYVDDSGALCFCDGSSWSPAAGGGTCS